MLVFITICSIIALLSLIFGLLMNLYMFGKTRRSLPAIICQTITLIAFLIIIEAILHLRDQSRYPKPRFEERFQQIEKDIFELKSYHQTGEHHDTEPPEASTKPSQDSNETGNSVQDTHVGGGVPGNRETDSVRLSGHEPDNVTH